MDYWTEVRDLGNSTDNDLQVGSGDRGVGDRERKGTKSSCCPAPGQGDRGGR